MNPHPVMYLSDHAQVAYTETGDLIITPGATAHIRIIEAKDLASWAQSPRHFATHRLEGWTYWQALDAGFRHGATVHLEDVAGYPALRIAHRGGLEVGLLAVPASRDCLPHLAGSECDFFVFTDGVFFRDRDTWQAAAFTWSDLLGDEP